MIKKLRTKFICINMALITVMLVIVFVLVFRFTRINLERESMAMMESVGSAPFMMFRPDDAREEVNLPFFVLHIDIAGNITAKGGGYYDLSDKEFLSGILTSAMESGADSGKIPEYHLRYLWVRDITGMRLVFADTTSEEATLRSLHLTCIGLGLVSFFAFLALSIFLSNWALKPAKISWEQQKQFIADASHELKTPLTVILTNAELLQSGEYPPEEQRQFSDSILKMTHQMRTLVERMLTLTRMDNNAANMVMENLDLSELMTDRLLPFEPLFFEGALALESRIPEGISITGSRDHLGQVLDILLDNALKYSAPGSVMVQLRRENNKAVFFVENPGEPIKPEDLKHIFKRFYRVNKARPRDGSTGLGLAIAESIVTAHKGRIWAESENGINRFSVELPML